VVLSSNLEPRMGDCIAGYHAASHRSRPVSQMWK
jgi:hypothetical protein